MLSEARNSCGCYDTPGDPSLCERRPTPQPTCPSERGKLTARRVPVEVAIDHPEALARGGPSDIGDLGRLGSLIQRCDLELETRPWKKGEHVGGATRRCRFNTDLGTDRTLDRRAPTCWATPGATTLPDFLGVIGVGTFVVRGAWKDLVLVELQGHSSEAIAPGDNPGWTKAVELGTAYGSPASSRLSL
jgi:hypothetical protein